MSFNSLAFLVFFPIVLLLYYALPHKYRWIELLLASYFFYAYFNFYLVFLILLTTCVSYFAALFVERAQKESTKKAWTVAAVVVCLGVLAFFKYFNFLSESVVGLVRLLGGKLDDFSLKLLLPVGISFYTFQTLSYVIDVYRGTVKAEKHFGYYALFVSFFPQLVAGPIERPENLLPQLKRENKFSWENAKSGFVTIVGGFVKKVVIADTLAVYVNAVYNSPDLNSVSGLSVAVATLLFVAQIYCDFSGYSDIATGCAKMMGVDLMKNFNKPFSSQSVTEFWSRWHISLSSWFNDYVYMPLAFKSIGKKHARLHYCFNIMLVFFLSGLWHGAAWTFVIWGSLNGLYQVIESFVRPAMQNSCKKRNKDFNARWRVVARTAGTFLLTGFTLLFFRANSIADAGTLLAKLFSDWSLTGDYFAAFSALTTIKLEDVAIIVLLVALLVLTDDLITTPRGKRVEGVGATVWNVSVVYVVWLVAASWLLLIASGHVSQFIYFQF